MPFRFIMVLLLVLVSAGANAQQLSDIDAYKALCRAIEDNNQTKAIRLIEDGVDVNYTPEDEMPLIALCMKYRSIAIAKLLINNELDLGVDLDMDGIKVPLLFGAAALYTGSSDERTLAMIELLLKKGANPNKQVDTLGIPILPFLVVAYGEGQTEDWDVVRLLVKYGADVNIEMNSNEDPDLVGITSLHLASYSYQDDALALVKYLVGKGANVNHQSKVGVTALEVSLEVKNYHIAKYLLRKGANPKLTSDLEKSPHVKAIEGKYPKDISKAIIKAAR